LSPENGPLEKAHLLITAGSTVNNATGRKLLAGRKPAHVSSKEHPVAPGCTQ
jgi:hypothetical protein